MYNGTGRRKESVAQVKLIPGSGKMIINKLSGPLYLQFNPNYLNICYAPLKIIGSNREYDILITARGGGLKGQTEAICLGISRALCVINPDNRNILKPKNYLTRNSKVKERKKYGLRKARKAPQYSKR